MTPSTSSTSRSFNLLPLNSSNDTSHTFLRSALPPSGLKGEMDMAPFMAHLVKKAPDQEAFEKWGKDFFNACPPNVSLPTETDVKPKTKQCLPDPSRLLSLLNENKEKLQWEVEKGLTAIQYLAKDKVDYVVAILMEMGDDGNLHAHFFAEMFLVYVAEDTRIAIANLVVRQKTWVPFKGKEVSGFGLFSARAKSFGIIQQSTVEALVEAHVAVYACEVAFHIQNYGITSQSTLEKIAKVAACKDGARLAQHIGGFGIKDPSVLLEIALLAAEHRRFSEHVANFGLKNESDRIKIAEKSLKIDSYIVSWNIDNFGIEDPVAKFRLAKMAAANCGLQIGNSLCKYGITEPSALVEIAEIAVRSPAHLCFEYMRHFKIKDPAARIKIAKIAAETHPAHISMGIEYFEIEDPLVLAEIATKAVRGGNLSQNIRKYRIKDQAVLIKLAKMVAESNAWNFSRHVGCFGIEDPSALAELALIILPSANGMSEYIRNFGIKDQAILIRLAKMAAESNERDLSQHIGAYGIEDQSALVEIATIAVRAGGRISEHIRNFGIKDQAILIKLAKMAAESNERDFSQHIGAYGIEDQSTLVEIAAIAVRAGGSISEHIRHYGIKDRAVLIELAQIAAASGEVDLSQYIGNYEIEDPAVLTKIAKTCAENGVWALSQHVGNYRIKSPAIRAEIAKIAAIRHGEYVSEYIANYDIEDQADLVEIAKIAVTNSASRTFRHLRKYGIKNETDFFYVFSLGLLSATMLRLSDVASFLKKNFKEEFWKLLLCNICRYMPKTLEDVKTNAAPFLKARMTEWVEIQQVRCACLVHIYVEKQTFHMLKKGEKPSVEILRKVMEEKLQKLDDIFLQLIHLGSLEERDLIAANLFQLFLESSAWDFFMGLETKGPYHLPMALACSNSLNSAAIASFAWQVHKISRIEDGPKMRQVAINLMSLWRANLSVDQKKNILVHQFIEHGDDILTLLDKLPSRKAVAGEVETKEKKGTKEQSQNEEAAKCKAQNKALGSRLISEFLALKGITSEKGKTRYSIKEAEIIKLSDIHNSREAKDAILHNIFFKQQNIMERMRLINALLNLDKGAEIAENSSLSLVALRQALQKQIMAVFELDEADFKIEEEFRTLWSTNIEKPLEGRYPEALFVYAGKINILPEPEKLAMKKVYAAFVTAFIKGPEALQALRVKSPHMASMEALLRASAGNKVAMENWECFKKSWGNLPSLCSLSAYLPAEKGSVKPFAMQFHQLLENTLVRDKHVAGWEKIFPLLQRYLNKPDEGSVLLKELHEVELSSSSVVPPDLTIQKNCLLLCTPQNPKEVDALLEGLRISVQKLQAEEGARFEQWIRDIEGFVKGLAEHRMMQSKMGKEVIYAQWRIGITRDPVDMLLLAKESGGCQAIDGTPALNKGALAYVIDYETCAVVIKDKHAKIKARAVLRALYDGVNGTPVLFLERHYNSMGDTSLSLALNTYAIAYAKQVGLPLVAKEAGHGVSYTGSVASLGSNAPFGYSDGAGGITQGAFEVRGSHCMY